MCTTNTTTTMNALTRTAMQVLPRAKSAMTQRSMATIRPGLHTGIPKSASDLRNNIWLSDAGAYPIIFVLSFATCFAGSYITYCCVKSPDVRISTGRRQQLIRDWE